MKKILFLGLILTLILSVSASAQVTDNKRYREQRETRSFRHGDHAGTSQDASIIMSFAIKWLAEGLIMMGEFPVMNADT
jgi:hypothetical protein